MRQVGADELQYLLASAMRKVPASVRKALCDLRTEPRMRAEAMVGGIAADALKRFEVLTDAPATADEAFSRPLGRMLGEDVGTGGIALD